MISKYYNSLSTSSPTMTATPLTPKKWTQVEEAAWKSAFLGERKVLIQTDEESDVIKIKQEMVNLNLVDIKNETWHYRSLKNYYVITGYFPDILAMKEINEIFQVYLKSVKRVITQLQELTPLENRCCRVLDEFFIDAQIAINKGQLWTTINDTSKEVDTPYDPASLEIIKQELSSFLKFRIVTVHCFLWAEEKILVWNLNNDHPKLYKNEVPTYLRGEFGDLEYLS